jgi:hypothetical protein
MTCSRLTVKSIKKTGISYLNVISCSSSSLKAHLWGLLPRVATRHTFAEAKYSGSINLRFKYLWRLSNVDLLVISMKYMM